MNLGNNIHRYIPHLKTLSVFDAMQSNYSPINPGLVLLLFDLLFLNGEVRVSCTGVQHLQVGQVFEGTLIYGVHRQGVKP